MSRYVIYGAGAVGGLIGARLHLVGKEVILIARGAHRHAMAERGVCLKTADGDQVARPAIVADPYEIGFSRDDIVILAMKTQDALPAIATIAALAPPTVTIVCAQNGLESERTALRYFECVHGAFLFVFAAFVEPGIVGCYSAPSYGIVDVGRYPVGTDARAIAIVADLQAAGFASEVQPDIMAWKRSKLLFNVRNAIDAACVPGEEADRIAAAAQAEAVACLAAEGLDFIPLEQVVSHASSALENRTIEGKGFPGGSMLQGLMRGRTTTEADYLNGEVVLMGRRTGIPTPVNLVLQQVAREVARERTAPRAIQTAVINERVAALQTDAP